MEIHDQHHHATFRLLIGIVALIIIGVAVYLIISYTAVQSASQTAITPSGAATSSPVAKPQPVASSTASSGSSTGNSPGSAPAVNEVVITNADMGKTIQIAKGTDFVVQLGGGLRWSVQFDPASAVTQLEGSSTDGIQGVYRTDQSGTISLRATGAPICKPDQACPMFMVAFNATILVP